MANGVSHSVVSLTTTAATALNSVGALTLDLYLMPTTTIYLGSSAVSSSGGGFPLTTAQAASGNGYKVTVWPGSVLYASTTLTTAVTVNVMTIAR